MSVTLNVKQRMKRFKVWGAWMLGLTLLLGLAGPGAARAEENQYFPQTGHNVSGKFLNYWRTNGGLATYGYPLTEPQMEVDPETGQTFLTQWFERNRFELHPELAGTRYEVLLGLLGKDLRREALKTNPAYGPTQPASGETFFNQTGHNVKGGFLAYWQQKGGLERFGYPISEEVQEVDPETGRTFQLQWFERARFEYHPENQPPYDILLGLLGKQLRQANTLPARTLTPVWKVAPNGNIPFSVEALTSDKQGNIYLINSNYGPELPGQLRVQKYNLVGQLVGQWGEQGRADGQLSNPQGIAVDSQGNIYISDSGNNRVEKFDSQGKFLFKFGRQGQADGQFEWPRDLTVDKDGNIYVTDAQNRRVEKFDSQGNFLLKWGQGGTGLGNFGNVGGIVTDAAGLVYVADPDNNRIQKFDSQGNFLAKWGTQGQADGQLSIPTSLGFDRQERLYVLDMFNQRVVKYDKQGLFLGKLAGPGKEPGQIYSNGFMTVSPGGEVYTAEYYKTYLQKYDDTGKYVGKVAAAKDDEFLCNSAMATDGAGNSFVLDNKLGRVQKFDGVGHFAALLPLSIVEGYERNIAADDAGNIYLPGSMENDQQIVKYNGAGQVLQSWKALQVPNVVAVNRAGEVYTITYRVNPKGPAYIRITRYNAQGQQLASWGSSGLGLGQFYSPQSLAFDSAGNVYVADTGNQLIQKFTPDGQFLTQWGGSGNGDDQLQGPSSIAIDAQDGVYILDSNNNRILKFDTAGRLLAKWNSPDKTFHGLAGLSLDGQGNLLLRDGCALAKYRLN